MQNNNYPALQHDPQDSPPFTEPIISCCVNTTRNVRNRNGETHLVCGVIEKNGATKTYSCAAQQPVDTAAAAEILVSLRSRVNEVHEENSIAYLIESRQIRDAVYGSVYLARVLCYSNATEVWQETDERCAIKLLLWTQIRDGRKSNRVENTEHEIAAMKHFESFYNETRAGGQPVHASDAMRDAQVIMPRDFLCDDEYLYIITPYCEGGELYRQLEDREMFSEEESRNHMTGILNALESIHGAQLCHGDISLENILVCQGSIIVIDMGGCKRIPYAGTDVAERCLISSQYPAGKPHYRAPEIAQMQPFDGHAVDMWSVGVCLYVMLVGKFPYECPFETNTKFRHISRGRFHIEHLSDNANDLLRKMLSRNPVHRLSLWQIRDHLWMTF